MTRSTRSSHLALAVFFGLLIVPQQSNGQNIPQPFAENNRTVRNSELPARRTGEKRINGEQGEAVEARSVVANEAIPVLGEEWVSIGAVSDNDHFSGQVNAIAVHPTDAATVYIGGSESGVWKTTDGGRTWRPLTDFQLARQLINAGRKGTLAIGSIAIDPVRPETVYVGTGDPYVSVFTGPSLGVFRSTDGGDTWNVMGSSLDQLGCQNGAISGATVNRIIVTPGTPTVVYAATNLGLFAYENNGSDCWKPVANGLPSSRNAVDMTRDPFRGELYVAFKSLGIFKTTNAPGAQVWEKLNGGLPSSGFSKIAITFAGRGPGFFLPPPLLYAGFATDTGYRLFKTIDGGSSWSRLPKPPNNSQLDFNNAIAVGLYSPNDLYVGQQALWRSRDGGAHGGLNDFKVDPPVSQNSWSKNTCGDCVDPLLAGLRPHVDFHDIVFAPHGSFVPTPSVLEIIYVANDGGVHKGFLDSAEIVSWKSVSHGLALSGASTIGLNPRDPTQTVMGLWHNGNALTRAGVTKPFGVGGGDGFQTTIDAAPSLTVYHNCNAGFGGTICRSKIGSFDLPKPASKRIWDSKSKIKFWSDPYRPGHLLRQEKETGKVFRSTNAAFWPANLLRDPASWKLIDPPTGKSGNTRALAFRSMLLETRPVYYLGTDTGQVWRGSPEVGWRKLCECGGFVEAIGADLLRNEKIYVVFRGSSNRGRIKELTREPNDTWTERNIDDTFNPELRIAFISSVVVDPLDEQGTTIYIGTDQGVYRGQLRPPVVSTLVGGPTVSDWVWTRSPGVPNLMVSDIEVHQGLQFGNKAGVIRAGTYGRGLYELRRSSAASLQTLPLTLTVSAIEEEEDGAPPALAANIAVTISGKRFNREAPFRLTQAAETEVMLEAPAEIRSEDRVLRFAGWVISDKRRGPQYKVVLKLTETSEAVAFYEKKEWLPNRKIEAIRASVSASAERPCVQSLTHRLNVSWDVLGGSEAVRVWSEITYPDKHVETTELKLLEGSEVLVLSFPTGGEVKVKIIARDSTNSNYVAESTVQLQPCQ